MKGISHFISGVAAATFFPWTLSSAQDGNPGYFILGGMFGILPDTLDFKIYRFFYRHDIYIEPKSGITTSQEIADQIADGIEKAASQLKMVRIKLSTIRLGADYWQQYSVKLDAANKQVLVKFGPVVNTGQVPVPGTTSEKSTIGRASFSCPLKVTYDATSNIDIFDGPTFGFKKEKTNISVAFHFLPWHREWSHSFIIGLLFAVLLFPFIGWKASLVIFAAYAIHVLEDQLGFMGSNLFFPLTKFRAQGIHIMRSGDSLPNFITVWLSCLLIFWNMYRYQASPMHNTGLLQILFWGGALPLSFFSLLNNWLNKQPFSDCNEKPCFSEWDDPDSV